jgi:hypothetical protein
MLEPGCAAGGSNMFEYDSEAHGPAARAPERDPAKIDAGRGHAAPSVAHLDATSMLHLQRTVGNAGVVQMLADEAADEQVEAGAGRSPVHDVIGGGGEPLDDGLRTDMESRFGQDFGDVRLHTDAQASASAESVGANAYTVGNDIVFKSGTYDASSPGGQRTLAHELSHVVQQRSGPVDGTDAPGGVRISDPDDRFERAASATADDVMRGAPSTSVGAGAGGAPTLQLEAEDEEAEAPVQRQEAGEEEEEEMGSA